MNRWISLLFLPILLYAWSLETDADYIAGIFKGKLVLVTNDSLLLVGKTRGLVEQTFSYRQFLGDLTGNVFVKDVIYLPIGEQLYRYDGELYSKVLETNGDIFAVYVGKNIYILTERGLSVYAKTGELKKTYEIYPAVWWYSQYGLYVSDGQNGILVLNDDVISDLPAVSSAPTLLEKIAYLPVGNTLIKVTASSISTVTYPATVLLGLPTSVITEDGTYDAQGDKIFNGSILPGEVIPFKGGYFVVSLSKTYYVSTLPLAVFPDIHSLVTDGNRVYILKTGKLESLDNLNGCYLVKNVIGIGYKPLTIFGTFLGQQPAIFINDMQTSSIVTAGNLFYITIDPNEFGFGQIIVSCKNGISSDNLTLVRVKNLPKSKFLVNISKEEINEGDTVIIKVYDEETKKLVPGLTFYVNGKKFYRDYYLKITFPSAGKYEINITKPGYETYSAIVEVHGFPLVPIIMVFVIIAGVVLYALRASGHI